MTGNITRRGVHSWRLKFEGAERDPVSGKRRTLYVTVRGNKRDTARVDSPFGRSSERNRR